VVANLHNWALNIFFLVGVLLALGVGMFLLVALLTGLKLWRWSRAERQIRDEYMRERYRPDGQPYPPAARGICDRCGGAFEKVYYLPTGQKLCQYDYDVLHPPVIEDTDDGTPSELNEARG
jgi:hypothetical protein